MTEPVVTKFCVIYDGSEHANHEMDIMTLGRSLSALGDVLYEANEVINGDRNSIDVRVSADLIEGSFGIEIELFQSLAQARDILGPLGLLGIGVVGTTVVSVINWLKGDDITIISSEENGVQTIVAGEKRIDCPNDIAKLVSNRTIRTSFESIVNAPLQKAGTSSFAIKRSKDTEENELFIDKDTSKSFVKLSVEETEDTKTEETNVKFIAANIRSKSGWKIEINNEEKISKMEDELFLERLLNMEEPHIFGRSFNVKLKTVTKNKLGSKTQKFYIEKVHHESLLQN